MRLFSLPDEVLEVVLKALLPPFRSQSLAETYVFTVPVDLLAARLVCRHLHDIATPFAWRRVQLQIASPAAKCYGNVDELDTGIYTKSTLFLMADKRKHALRSLARCRFFDEYPHLAVHVRVLLVSLEWHAEHPERACDALRTATHAMSNLRAVLMWDADVLPFHDIRALFQRPHMRLVRLMDVDGSAFPAHGGWGVGLKMLHIANSVCPAKLIVGAAATLECVSIELARTRPSTQSTPNLRDMPWKTLKEVALVDCVNEEDWSCFLQGFRHHRHHSRPSALKELIVGDLGGLKHTRVTQFLFTFGGHPLRRLSLYHIFVDPDVLADIVSAFPTLTDLTLLTHGALMSWPGVLDAYARELLGLPNLVSLSWNNFALDSATDALFPSMSVAELSQLYAEHVHALTRSVPTLWYVRLISITDGIVDTVNARCRETIHVTRCADSVILHTSSWSTSSEAFEDL